MLNTHSDYITFFRNIAANHTALLHNPPDRISFIRLISSGAPFAKMLNVSEMLTKVRDIRPPFMLLESYDDGWMDQRSDNYLKKIEGAFVILDKPSDDGFDNIETTLNSTELIANDIIAFMKSYFAANLGSLKLDLNSLMGEKMGPIGDGPYYGHRKAFIYYEASNRQLVVDSTKWNSGFL